MKQIIDTTEAAEILNVTRSRIHQYIKDGRLPVLGRIGQSYILDEKDIDKIKVKKTGRPQKEIPPKLKKRLEENLSYLTSTEKEIIVLRFGLGGEPRKTLVKIGKLKDMTRQAVHSIFKRALRKIKNLEN